MAVKCHQRRSDAKRTSRGRRARYARNNSSLTTLVVLLPLRLVAGVHDVIGGQESSLLATNLSQCRIQQFLQQSLHLILGVAEQLHDFGAEAHCDHGWHQGLDAQRAFQPLLVLRVLCSDDHRHLWKFGTDGSSHLVCSVPALVGYHHDASLPNFEDVQDLAARNIGQEDRKSGCPRLCCDGGIVFENYVLCLTLLIQQVAHGAPNHVVTAYGNEAISTLCDLLDIGSCSLILPLQVSHTASLSKPACHPVCSGRQ
mmetsp:Transcript_7904/g.16835  ORF Transcript_7904/g.16835 Transcript_7904/m.16835 type:complete len:256 (-) Transcript_7904:10-777(-)